MLLNTCATGATDSTAASAAACSIVVVLWQLFLLLFSLCDSSCVIVYFDFSRWNGEVLYTVYGTIVAVCECRTVSGEKKMNCKILRCSIVQHKTKFKRSLVPWHYSNLIWEFCSVFCSWALCANCAFVFLQFILFYFGSAPNAMLFILSPCLSFSREYGDSFNTICTHTQAHAHTHTRSHACIMYALRSRTQCIQNSLTVERTNDCTNQLHVNPDQSFDKLSMHRETKK